MIFFQIILTLLLIIVLIPILWFAKESVKEGSIPLSVLFVVLSIIVLFFLFSIWYYGISPSDSNAQLHAMPSNIGLPPVMYY